MYYTLAELRGPYLHPRQKTDYVHHYTDAAMHSLSNPTKFRKVSNLRQKRESDLPNIVREEKEQTLMSLPHLRFYYK
jgi:hypothetical protein